MDPKPYRIKQLLLGVSIMLALALVIIFLLPPSEGPLSEEDKTRILKELSKRSLYQPSLFERHVVLEGLADRAILSEDFARSPEEKLNVLTSLQSE